MSKYIKNSVTVIQKNQSLPMKVLVPASVDVKLVVAELKLSPTLSRNLKNKIYYFLSRIVSTNDNYKLNEKNNGYRNICSDLMKKVLDNRHYNLIIDILSNPLDPVIETDGSWHNPATSKGEATCKGYRLTLKYNTGEVIFKTLHPKFSKRVLKHIEDDNEDTMLNEKYQFLLDQFSQHQLKFDPLVYDYIRSFGLKLLSRVDNDNEYQTKMVLNQIGRWLYFIKRIEENQLWAIVSPDNHRMNSSITNLPKILRPFLRCDGQQLIEVDVSSCQPYILSSVMKNRFFTGTGIGYNLNHVYPEIYVELVNRKFISPTCGNDYNYSNTIDDTNCTSNNYYSSNTGYTSNFYSSITSNPCSYMWCQFFTQQELDSIRRYRESPFHQDFYTYVIKSYDQFSGEFESADVDYESQRKKLKGAMMFVLFEDNQKHRNHNPNISIFNSVFPGVGKWLNECHRVIGKHRFSYLLQRTESYLVLDVVAREFNRQYPTAPIFTIHDGLYTWREYLPDLTSLVLGQLQGITGIEVGVKTKCQESNPEPQIDDVDKVWDKIKDITTLPKYEKVRGGVFSTNVARGSEFLKNPENIFSTTLNLCTEEGFCP